ncbi:MAG: hypothetical protein AAFP92_08495 [Bacteroidota bacterium]
MTTGNTNHQADTTRCHTYHQTGTTHRNTGFQPVNPHHTGFQPVFTSTQALTPKIFP